MHFVPLALNHPGLRGPHFQAILEEFASILVTKPEGCFLVMVLLLLFIPEPCIRF